MPDLFGFVVLILMCLIAVFFFFALKCNYIFFPPISRNTKLEECGADSGQKIPTRQESLWWVWRFIVCPTFYEDSCLAVCEPLRAGLKRLFVSALRRGVGADGVEQHAADGGQRPEQTLREERTDRSQNERTGASQLSPQVCMLSFYLSVHVIMLLSMTLMLKVVVLIVMRVKSHNVEEPTTTLGCLF